VNIFKRIKHFYEYKKLVKNCSTELHDNFSIRIDNIYRLYTVVNIPDETLIYGPDHSDALTEEWLRKWLVSLDTLLVNNHLKEFIIREELTRIDNQNFLIVLRYKYLNIEKIHYIFYILGIITFITFLVILFIKLI